MHDQLATDERKQAYERLLSQMCDGNQALDIPNRYPWHTKIAFELLLKLAARRQTSVKIITGSACDAFYRKVKDELIHALEAGCDIHVLVWNTSDGQRDVVQELKAKYKSSFQVVYSESTRMSGDIPHFILVGDSAYRLEYPHEERSCTQVYSDNEPVCEAVINFNNPALGKSLNRFFDRMVDTVSQAKK